MTAKTTGMGDGLAAVIVGISDYGTRMPHLPGCLNDAKAWHDLLAERYGVPATRVRILSNRRATRPGVLDALRWLFDQRSICPHLLFCYAGHGTLVSRPGGQPGGGGAELEEAIICRSTSPGSIDSGYLLDDDLSAALSAAGANLATVRLTLVIDACHAGGFLRAGARRASSASVRHFPPDTASVRIASVGAPACRFGLLARATRGGAGRPILMAAAHANQSAFDDSMDDGRHHGVFSYYATKSLRDDRELSYRQLIAAVNQQIRGRFDQAPQVEGDHHRFDLPFLQ